MLESIVDFLAGGLAFDLRVLACIAIASFDKAKYMVKT